METTLPHMETLHGYPTSLYRIICDSLTTIFFKSSHSNLLQICQMAVFNIFV